VPAILLWIERLSLLKIIATAIQRCQVHYAALRIMPISAAKPAWEALIAV